MSERMVWNKVIRKILRDGRIVRDYPLLDWCRAQAAKAQP